MDRHSPQRITTVSRFFLDRPIIERNRIPERIDTIIRILIRYLIISNVILGIFTIFNLYLYPKYIYEAPPMTRDISTLYPNEI